MRATVIAIENAFESFPEVSVVVDGRIRHLTLHPEITRARIVELVGILRLMGVEFALYDPVYPSPTDPGAYLSYSPKSPVPGAWGMTLGNHGWSGGIYRVSEDTIAQQIFSLLQRNVPVELDCGPCFARHHAPESEKNNVEMEQRLRRLHPVSVD